jgi:hypothetical protein
MGFALGLHGLKPGFAWFQTQDKPAKNRVYFLTTPKGKFMLIRSSNLPEERRYADLYLLGVVDATEGKVWCGYRKRLTISILEWIDTGLKKLDES